MNRTQKGGFFKIILTPLLDAATMAAFAFALPLLSGRLGAGDGWNILLLQKSFSAPFSALFD
ncbi:MAG: hypothetical protein JXB26_00030 [Candidatus Aminicenantes bacterium]|nr:hypothetical protein [Candidatus Aminicenantes bacterium]